MTVFLVGAGPGSADLLTVKAARLVAEADVIVHDRLADPAILELARPGTEFIDVGKQPGRPTPQEIINTLLVHLGQQGLNVVRLKGGDPFVFGRGGEEADALRSAGVPFETVPGITSAVGVPAAAGIPVTHRGVSASFTVVTGHRERGGSTNIEWEALAKVG
ncbi:MAG: uroporphyrinogen-III C-methyltransferase, partial [Actinobacteria bacterium]|nr:uroporphyrinogen-III C-methyltransferase [Actinomycetota bacterium]